MEKSFHDGSLDISMVEDVEILISQLHPSMLPVLHVNTKEGCQLRICMIGGNITFSDSSYKKKIINCNDLNHVTGDTIGICHESKENSNICEEPKG